MSRWLAWALSSALPFLLAWGWMRPRRLLTFLVLPATVVTVWSIAQLTFLEPRTYRWFITFVTLAWGVVVASAALRLPTPIRPLLEARPLAFLGRISYSVYLWHLPIIAEVARHHPNDPLVVTAIAAPLTLAIGWLSYTVVEAPLLSAAGRARLRARLA